MIIRIPIRKFLINKSIAFPLLAQNTPKFAYSEKDERFVSLLITLVKIH